jgi:hypothetical protein
VAASYAVRIIATAMGTSANDAIDSQSTREHGSFSYAPKYATGRRSRKPRVIAARPQREQEERLKEILDHVSEVFEQKVNASTNRTWCDPIPIQRKVETIQCHLKEMMDEDTLPTATCRFCYLKKSAKELGGLSWQTELSADLRQKFEHLLRCRQCFPLDEDEDGVPTCTTCLRSIRLGKMPKDCAGNNTFIGCEHLYPDALKHLTPIEEKLIGLNASYGYITKFTVSKTKMGGVAYRRHIKGHITVFPNDVETLATTVLPHPLVTALDTIHIIWTGTNQPTPRDVSKLLSVRKQVVLDALSWLIRHNPLYATIRIDTAEISSWEYEAQSDVPTAVMGRLQIERETAVEQIRTGHYVPDGDRGLEVPDGRTSLSIEEVVAGLTSTARTGADDGIDAGISTASEEAAADEHEVPSDVLEAEIREMTFELTSTGMFPLDEASSFAEERKLQFISNALEREYASDEVGRGVGEEAGIRVEEGSHQPFIRVSHGAQFADSLDPDFFPETFPTLFPFGRGGPVAFESEGVNHSLQYWAKTVLQRHGGRFATHPVFLFLVFNKLVRSSNRRISMARMARPAFSRFERVYDRLSPEKLQRASEEMRETGSTTDRDIQSLLRELSIFGYAQPMSNDSMMDMRRKINSLCIYIGLQSIWFTINPNDINNPVKLRLAAHRDRDSEAAASLLQDLYRGLEKTALSINDPVSSAMFFFREISSFFTHYVRTGRDSIYGKVSHYYGTVETNERGALHLHGFLWLEGNLEQAQLIKAMADPAEEAYRQKVEDFVDDIFTECLDENQGKEIRRGQKVTEVPPELVHDAQHLRETFEAEANFVAYCCQIHTHSATCVKYHAKEITSGSVDWKKKKPRCRFQAPWRLVEDTTFTEEGLLRVRRNHRMVNRHNQSMAIGLRHNHDICMILTRTQGSALFYYATNYATKLHTPMYQRIASAAEVYQRMMGEESNTDEQEGGSRAEGGNPQTNNKARQFLMRVANRVFTDRELSAVEVANHLLGYPANYTNVQNWTYLRLNTLYWALARRWPHLQAAVEEHAGAERQVETVQVRGQGFQLSPLEAYGYRGPVLAKLCFYDYLSFVKLVKLESLGWRSGSGRIVPFAVGSDLCEGWVQQLREPAQTAIPVLQGELKDNHEETHPLYVKR